MEHIYPKLGGLWQQSFYTLYSFCGSGTEEGLGWVVLALGLSDRWLEVQGAGVAGAWLDNSLFLSLHLVSGSLCGEFTWGVWASSEHGGLRPVRLVTGG